LSYLVVDIDVLCLSERLNHAIKCWSTQLCKGIRSLSDLALFLEEPLTQILLIACLGPLVVVNIQDFLLVLALFLGWRWSFSFFSFSCLGLLYFRRLLQLKIFIMRFMILVRPNSQISYRSNASFDLVEILTDGLIVIITVVANDHVSIVVLLNKLSYFLNTVGSKVVESKVVYDCEVLEQQSMVFLDQINSRSQDIFQ